MILLRTWHNSCRFAGSIGQQAKKCLLRDLRGFHVGMLRDGSHALGVRPAYAGQCGKGVAEERNDLPLPHVPRVSLIISVCCT